MSDKPKATMANTPNPFITRVTDAEVRGFYMMLNRLKHELRCELDFPRWQDMGWHHYEIIKATRVLMKRRGIHHDSPWLGGM